MVRHSYYCAEDEISKELLPNSGKSAGPRLCYVFNEGVTTAIQKSDAKKEAILLSGLAHDRQRIP
ncbi:hypothetical protein HO133_006348 [Letharia lupina]|uniref:Uncharacterized protein n=1 Tax=Letharia lupina TaxID=560253 RepID=A0A8H6C761_9LECA|nr:uncharacterized protein HO133_006348 [Letharia lupina]KAF6217936.1 hypothetical protein HO133_006348 [Letharia lupina]